MSHCKEGRLKPAVITFLLSRCMTPVFEVERCDVVGVQFEEKVKPGIPDIIQLHAVELKLDDAGGVLTQCRCNCFWFPYCWAAMPAERIAKFKALTHKRFLESGVGLLSVSETGVTVVLEATQNEIDVSRYKSNLWRRRREYPKRLR